jgi:hypothetical protein
VTPRYCELRDRGPLRLFFEGWIWAEIGIGIAIAVSTWQKGKPHEPAADDAADDAVVVAADDAIVAADDAVVAAADAVVVAAADAVVVAADDAVVAADDAIVADDADDAIVADGADDADADDAAGALYGRSSCDEDGRRPRPWLLQRSRL